MMRAALVLALLATAFAPAEAMAQRRGQPSQSRFGDLRDWLVACDNRRDCRAIGFRDRNGTAQGALVIDREADADAAPAISLNLGSLGDATSEIRDGMAIEVTADTVNLGRMLVGEGIVVEDEERVRLRIRNETVRQSILGALRSARRLAFAIPGRDQPFEISLDGASAALLFMDDRQRRVGTVTALVRRGAEPASAVPAPPPLPERPQVTRAASWQPTPRRVPGTVLQRIRPPADDCSAVESNEPTDAATLGRVGADLVLVRVLCWRGAYNESYRFHLWNDRTGRITPVAFAVPEGLEGREGGRSEDTLVNPDFDARSLIITHFSKGRGLGDCGSSGSWHWDGRAFRLVAYEYMPECQGLMPGDWLTLHRSR